VRFHFEARGAQALHLTPAQYRELGELLPDDEALAACGVHKGQLVAALGRAAGWASHLLEDEARTAAAKLDKWFRAAAAAKGAA
jgi:hypothetical protein